MKSKKMVLGKATLNYSKKNAAADKKRIKENAKRRSMYKWKMWMSDLYEKEHRELVEIGRASCRERVYRLV